jgi:hypothetical protein
MVIYKMMTKHITVELEEAELARARLAADAQGIALEEYLRKLIAENLPPAAKPDLRRQKQFLSKIIGSGSSVEPTDIAKDKDRFLAEAVWDDYLRKTKQE